MTPLPFLFMAWVRAHFPPFLFPLSAFGSVAICLFSHFQSRRVNELDPSQITCVKAFSPPLLFLSSVGRWLFPGWLVWLLPMENLTDTLFLGNRPFFDGFVHGRIFLVADGRHGEEVPLAVSLSLLSTSWSPPLFEGSPAHRHQRVRSSTVHHLSPLRYDSCVRVLRGSQASKATPQTSTGPPYGRCHLSLLLPIG